MKEDITIVRKRNKAGMSSLLLIWFSKQKEENIPLIVPLMYRLLKITSAV